MDDIRAILSPLFLLSYVFGIKIIEFPATHPRLWYRFVYILLLWSVYNFLFWCTILRFVMYKSLFWQSCFWLNYSTALLSVAFEMYHDKKYKTCLRKLTIVDDTLEQIGISTNYQKLYTKILFIAFGWFACVICITSCSTLVYRHRHNIIQIYYSIMFHYTFYVNCLDDLITVSTLGYIEEKFKQLNEFLRKLEEDNDQRIKGTREHSTLLLSQIGCRKSKKSEYATWILIHLHLELCKISHELNSIFGLKVTLKIGAYFNSMILGFNELFHLIFIIKYKERKALFIILHIFFLVLNVFIFFIINYMCDRVIVEANTTGNVINRISYSTSDIVVRENISQFLLQTSLRPLKFYGLGFFQFGLQFFYGFSSSLTTVIVILVQSHTRT